MWNAINWFVLYGYNSNSSSKTLTSSTFYVWVISISTGLGSLLSRFESKTLNDYLLISFVANIR